MYSHLSFYFSVQMFFWICIALILFIIDLLTSGALVIGFTVSAIITAMLSVILPVALEVVCFVIMSVLLIVHSIASYKNVRFAEKNLSLVLTYHQASQVGS